MNTVSQVIINQTWHRMSNLEPEQAQPVFSRLEKQQPYILAYALALEEHVRGDLPPAERGKYVFIATTIVEIMTTAAARVLRQVTGKEIDATEAENIGALERLEEGSEAEYTAAVQKLITNYNQAPLLGSVIEALMEGNEETPEMAGDEVGIGLLYFKTIIDCLDKIVGDEPARPLATEPETV